MKRHAAHVKEQIGRLSSKAYWNQFSQSPELAVLFLGESSLVSALEVEPTLMEDSMAKRVLIATPTTLFALLTAVAYGWRQEQVTKNAELIASLGKEIYERFAVWSRHFGDISTALGKAVDAYNRAAGSIESRILPSVRKFKELGATGAEEITLLKQIDLTPKNLNFSEPDADKG
jgi:DNA recombination protein RmuC